MASVDGAKAASWNGLVFSRWVVRVRDQFGPSFVAHRIPHRSGAKQEQTGNVPFRVVYDLVFAGRTWADDAHTVLGKFIAEPRGTLVHHLRPKPMRAVINPIDASWDPCNLGNHYAATVTIEEDTLTNDTSFSKSPGAVGQDLAADADAADSAAASFKMDVFSKFKVGIPALNMRVRTLAAQAGTTALTTAAREYGSAAISQFENGQLQPTLFSKLGLLPPLLDASTNAYRALPVVSPYAQLAIGAGERVLASAELLKRTINANLPPPIRWTVTQASTLFVLIGRLYPSRNLDEKIALLGSIVLQNGLVRPDALREGQVLTIPAP